MSSASSCGESLCIDDEDDEGGTEDVMLIGSADRGYIDDLVVYVVV